MCFGVCALECAAERRVASFKSSCASCIQPVVTSPDRSGSHALLIQSPQPSRAIEPISLYIALWRVSAHPRSWSVFRFRHMGHFWHQNIFTLTLSSQSLFEAKNNIHCVPSSFYQAYSCSLAMMRKCVQTNTHMH